MVSMIRDITERKLAEEKEKQHSRQLESLLEIGQELATQLDLDLLLNLIVKHAVELLDGVSGGLYLYRPEQDVLEWVVTYGPNLVPPGATLSINQGISGRVWATGEAMIIDDYSEWDGRSSIYDSFDWKAILAAPVYWGKELLGVINVLADKPNVFTANHKKLLEVFASVAATAIHNARLFSAERDQRLRAETLVEVTLALTVQTSFSAVLDEILRQTLRLVSCETANIALIKNGNLETAHHIGYDSETINLAAVQDFPLAQLPVIANLINTGQPLVIKDTRRQPGWVFLPGSEWIRSFMAVPIHLRKEVIGVLRLDSPTANGFSDLDAERLAPLANAAAIALSRALTLEQAQQEIFDRVQAEEALIESLRLIEQAKQDWETTADSFDQIVGLLDAQGNLIRINRTVQSWGLGDFTRVKGRNIHDVLHPNCPDPDCYFIGHWAETWPRIIAGGQSDYEVQDAILGRYLRFQLRPIISSHQNKAQFSDGSTLRSAVIVIYDITERKRVDEAILHTQKLESLGILAGDIAHDFNNLLASILSENSIALLRLSHNEPARSNLERAVQTIERAADLTRQLLAYSGKGQFKKIPLNLNKLVKENLLLLESSIPRHIKLTTELADDLPPILADAGQIQQVVMNLILNAAEAHEDKPGDVALSTWTEIIKREGELDFPATLGPGRYVCLSVTDKGVGMDEETVARIFDPFFTTKFTGRGLGLAAVSGIIRQHKGDIQVESQIGLGTVFKVFLPATDEKEVVEKSEPVSTTVKQACVLVIDDELSIRVAIADFLRYVGQKVLLAENGKAGLALFEENLDEIDIVMLDLTMPAMSGKETLIELHKIQPTLPVILLSGFSEEEALQQIGESDQVDFLQKPFRLAALLEKLNTLLG